MSTIKKGILTSPPIWAKHLRPWGKREFWHRERKAAERDAQERVEETAAINAIDREVDWIVGKHDALPPA